MSEHHYDEKNDRSANMRAALARVGIQLDEPRIASPTASQAAAVEPDRAAIRAYFEPLGTPEWAIIACPSMEHAKTWRPRCT